ncbi:MAG: FixH family protein [Pseudomonadota bacterium]
MTTELKGRHVLATFVLCFSVIIAVNLTLAFSAIRTFPGLEVKNSYVASQAFDADRSAQLALGWEIGIAVSKDQLVLSILDDTGPVNPLITRATLGRATHVHEDQELVFEFDGRVHRADVAPLGMGNWNLRLAATAPNGTGFKQRVKFRVRE